MGVAVLALLDEPGVLGEAARVEEERDAVAVADLADGAQVRERYRLAATRVVRDRDEHHRDALDAAVADEGIQRVGVHVPLERVDRGWLPSLGDDAVDRLGAGELDVRARRVEVGVRRDDLAGAADHAEQDLLRRATLMRGDHVAERPQLGDRLEEPEPGRGAGVGFVAALDAGPLLGRHRTRPGVGEQVDQHVRGVEVEQVVPRLGERGRALFRRRHPDRLHALDPERLDDRPPALHGPMVAGGGGRPPQCMMRG
jgi:hypothetical protein